jgi:serine/threonine-protein kinase
MLSPEGEVKIVDTGSAIEWRECGWPSFYTPRYAAVEVLERGECSPRSDLASLGYVLIELLQGGLTFSDPAASSLLETSMAQSTPPGPPPKVYRQLIQEKCRLANEVGGIFSRYGSLVSELCRRLIDPDARHQFASACEAELAAYRYLAKLEKDNMGCHYHHEFRRWLKALD